MIPYLLDKGYIVSDLRDVSLYTWPESTHVITINVTEDRVVKNWRGKSKSVKDRFIVGTLWFSNELRKADYNKRWVLKMNGEKYFDQMIELATELSDKFDMEIDVEKCGYYPSVPYTSRGYDY